MSELQELVLKHTFMQVISPHNTFALPVSRQSTCLWYLQTVQNRDSRNWIWKLYSNMSRCRLLPAKTWGRQKCVLGSCGWCCWKISSKTNALEELRLIRSRIFLCACTREHLVVGCLWYFGFNDFRGIFVEHVFKERWQEVRGPHWRNTITWNRPKAEQGSLSTLQETAGKQGGSHLHHLHEKLLKLIRLHQLRWSLHFLSHGSLNVPIEHHPTIRYMVYNGYYKVMFNIPKMGQLPTPVSCHWLWHPQLVISPWLPQNRASSSPAGRLEGSQGRLLHTALHLWAAKFRWHHAFAVLGTAEPWRRAPQFGPPWLLVIPIWLRLKNGIPVRPRTTCHEICRFQSSAIHFGGSKMSISTNYVILVYISHVQKLTHLD